MASASGLSPRFLSQLEAGEGNISVLKLARVAEALGTTPDQLLRAPRRIVALLGLRGAGKSSVGERLASRLALPFVELDREIERRAGLSLRELFDLHGEGYYRRLEQATLREVVAREEIARRGAILAVGGSLVTDRDSWAFLREHASTVWLRATPEEHLSRVLAQGDLRPMTGHADSLAEIRRLLEAREPLYAESDLVVETGELPADRIPEEILRRLQAGGAGAPPLRVATRP